MAQAQALSATKPAKPSWRRGDRGQLAVVAFSHAIQHSYVAVLGIVYPFALADFHSTYAVLGVILGIAGVLGGLLQGVAGLVKRTSTRVLLAGQNLGMAIVSGLGAASPDIGVFGLARVLGNLTSWPQHPVGSAHLTERVPHRRGLALSVHTTGGNIGTLLAPLAASAALAAFGWRWALGGAGAVMALGSLVTWAGVRGQPRASKASGPPEPAGRASATEQASSRPGATPARASLRKALRRRQAVAVLVAGVVSGAGRGLGVLTTYIPAYLRSGLHEQALTVGALTTVVSAGAIFGPMVGGHLSDRLGRRPVLYTLYGCGAAALAAFTFVGSALWLLALVGLAVGVFAYSEQPIRQALFSDALEDVSPRQAFGAYFAISQSMGSLWITALGFLVTAVSFKAAFLTMGGSFVLAAAIIAFGAKGGGMPAGRPVADLVREQPGSTPE